MRTPSIDVLRFERDIHPASRGGGILLSVLLAFSMLGGASSGARAMEHSPKEAVVQEATEIDCNISSLADELTSLRQEARDIAAVQMGYLGVDAAGRNKLSGYLEGENRQVDDTPSQQVAADIAGEIVTEARALLASTETWISLIREVNADKKSDVELAVSEYSALHDHIKAVGQKAAILQHARASKAEDWKAAGVHLERDFYGTPSDCKYAKAGGFDGLWSLKGDLHPIFEIAGEKVTFFGLGGTDGCTPEAGPLTYATDKDASFDVKYCAGAAITLFKLRRDLGSYQLEFCAANPTSECDAGAIDVRTITRAKN